MATLLEEIILLPLAQKAPTIGEIVAVDYRKAEVFRKYGLDYCCGGKKSIEDACNSKGIDPRAVWADLDRLDQTPPESSQDFEKWPADMLAEYIVARHHRYVTEALPILYELTAKVARVHGGRHPELLEIAWSFNALARELTMHMQKEEHVLFPYVKIMAAHQQQGKAIPAPFFGSVENPIQMMETEHETAGRLMETIRTLSNDYTAPAGACTSYRVLFAKLHEFEQDLHRHVHLENNVLFPKAIQLENARFVA